MKKTIALILVLTTLLTLASCGMLFPKAKDGKAKTFSVSGMQITLTDSFSEMELDGYEAAYSTRDVFVIMLKESFDLTTSAGISDFAGYAETVHQGNENYSPTELMTEEGLTYFEYTFLNTDKNMTLTYFKSPTELMTEEGLTYSVLITDENKTYKYFTVMLEGTDAFWTVQFACEVSEYDGYKSYFVNWAKSIQFSAV